MLAVIYLVFNEGYSAGEGPLVRVDLCEEAIRLGRLLDSLMPRVPEIEGLLALMLLHHARSGTRIGDAGEMVALEDQDRTRWDRARIAEGAALVERALRRGRPGPHQLQAAIAAIHAEAGSFAETDWREIALIYRELTAMRPNPVFELNRVVAVSYSDGPDAALDLLAPLAPVLASYQPFHAVRADLLARSGKGGLAREAYGKAIALSQSEAEKGFLAARMEKLAAGG